MNYFTIPGPGDFTPPDYYARGTGNVAECECTHELTALELELDECESCGLPVIGKEETA